MLKITNIRKMQIKAITKHHLILVSMSVIKKIANNKCWQACRKKGTPCITGGIVNWCNHYGKKCGVSAKKLKIELPYDSEISLPGIYQKKNLIWKYICISIFTAVLFIVAKIWEQPQCLSIDIHIKQMCHVCLCIYIYIHKHTHTHMKWLNTHHLKRWNLVIRDKMTGSTVYYTM